MELLIIFLQTLGITFMVFCTLIVVIVVRIFLKNLREIQNTRDNDDQLKRSMLVYIEKIGDTMYLYDKMSNFFIAQSADEKDLWKRAEERCPDTNFILADNGSK